MAAPHWWLAPLVLGAMLVVFVLGAPARSQDSPPSKDNGEFGKADDDKSDADKAKSGDKKAKDKDSEDEMKPTTEQDREALPRGVSVPTARPAEFTLNDPKTTDEEWKKWSAGKSRGDFNTRVQNGDHDAQSDKIIQDGIREQLAAMTLPSMRDPKADRFQMSAIVQDVLRYVRQAAAKKPAGDQKQFRIFMMQEIIKDCRELQLARNQYYVRLNTAVLLGNLFTEEYNASTKAEPEFYTPAFDALMDILNVEGQSEAVKLTAIMGLRNACLYGNPPPQVNDNVNFAKKLISELEKPGTNEWYQERVCDALSCIDQAHDLNGQPFIVQALSKVLFDTSRPLCVRGAAARALGRTPLDPSIDLNVISYGIADLCRQMVESRNDGKKHVSRRCIAYILLAFLPQNTPEKSHHAGLLDRVDEATYSRFRKPVTQVWAILKPVVVEELRHRAEPDVEFPTEVLTPIVEWLKGNTPTDLRISPGMPPVTTTQVTKVESNGRK